MCVSRAVLGRGGLLYLEEHDWMKGGPKAYVFACVTLEMECYTQSASVTVPLLLFIRGHQLDNHIMSFTSVVMSTVYRFLFVFETFWLGPLLLTDQHKLCKVFSTKTLIDLSTEALFAHLAGKLALLFGKL